MIEKIYEIVEKEVDNRVKEIKKELLKTKKEYNNLIKKYNDLKLENEKLKSNKLNLDLFQQIKSSLKELNIIDVLKFLNLKVSSIYRDISADEIPTWFYCLLYFYDDKDKMFDIFDFLDFKYPSWAKKIKLPFDYNEEEMDIVFKNLDNLSMVNGWYFSPSNVKYYYETLNHTKGEFKKLFNSYYSSYIPWQFLLRNPLLKEEKYFSQIIKYIKNKGYNALNFYYIHKYQELELEQLARMAELIPTKGRYDAHLTFIKENSKLFKYYPSIAINFKDKMTTYKGDFYFLNFPLYMQIDFLKSFSDLDIIVSCVKLMEINEEEKMKLISEIIKERLEDYNL